MSLPSSVTCVLYTHTHTHRYSAVCMLFTQVIHGKRYLYALYPCTGPAYDE